MSVYGWKSFMEDEGQPEKPRIYGVREMIGPNYTFLNRNVLQDILESMGQVTGQNICSVNDRLLSSSMLKNVNC
ncbi:hypothetical protein AAC387_Pa05g1098 [Persea americana]